MANNKPDKKSDTKVELRINTADMAMIRRFRLRIAERDMDIQQGVEAAVRLWLDECDEQYGAITINPPTVTPGRRVRQSGILPAKVVGQK